MHTIDVSIRTLEEFGIIGLTGEAEGVSGLGRVLCDLTKQGTEIVAEFLGMPLTFRYDDNGISSAVEFSSNWNSQGIVSFMLPRGMIKDLLIYCFLQRHNYVVEVEVDSKSNFKPIYELYAFDDLEEMKEYPEFQIVQRYYKTGTAGCRNVHEMSGRTI